MHPIMFPDQHGRSFNVVRSFSSVQLVVSASERQVRLDGAATLTSVGQTTDSQVPVALTVPASEPDGSRPLHSPPPSYSLTWSPPTGVPPSAGRAEARGLFGTMAARILVFAAILLAAFAPTVHTSPRLADFQHRSLNSVSDEVVPLKEKEGGRGGHLRQKFLLEPSEGCGGAKLYFLVIVHSAPSHFRFPTVKKFWQ